MHKVLIIAAVALSLTACTTTQKGAAVGGIGGAVAGATLSGGSLVGTAIGAGVGTVVGAAAGELVGKVRGSEDRCVYIVRGERVIDACPRG